MIHSEVIVVGAGPTGLMVAAELALAGIQVSIIEKESVRTQQSRAMTLHPRSLEVLSQRGILDRFLAKGRVLPAGHFAMFLARLDFTVLDTKQNYTLFIPQFETEALLEEWALSLGVRILRGQELVQLYQESSHVTLYVKGPKETSIMHALYVVGADGARSMVRQQAGIDFSGTNTTFTMMLGDVLFDNPPASPFFSLNTIRGGIAIAPMSSTIYRVILLDANQMFKDTKTPVSLEELRESMRQITETDVGAHSPVWLSRFGNATRLATQYRKGRVFLAGDAAHIHLPAGGQGLNVGLQDAANLGWKLAAHLRGWASPDLVDSYHAERHAVGEALVKNTVIQTELVKAMITQEGEWVRELVAQLLQFDGPNRLLSNQGSALDIQYEIPGSELDALAGKRLPDLKLLVAGKPSNLHSYMYKGQYVLLLLDQAMNLDHLLRPELLLHTCILPVSVQEPRPELEDKKAVLIRPDGHIAWSI